MSCIEGKGVSKDIHCLAQNAALFVNLFKISFVSKDVIYREALIHQRNFNPSLIGQEKKELDTNMSKGIKIKHWGETFSWHQ